MNATIQDVAEGLLQTIYHQNFKGFDPFDAKANPTMRALIGWGDRFYIAEVVREIVLEVLYQYPIATRKILRVKPAHNAKALALIGTACTELSLLKPSNTALLNGALTLLDGLLDDQMSVTHDGLGWGYPFHWQSTQLIPASTPNGIVTTAVGEYVWTKFRLSANHRDLDTCHRIAHFLNHLPVDE